MTDDRTGDMGTADAREGGCACGSIRYRLTGAPLIVHACHCRDCQRITGSAFVINVWIERKLVELVCGAAKSFHTRGGTGEAHEVSFCEACGTTLWSRYALAPGDCLFVRAGTLDRPEAIRPDVHIFTRTKLPWLALPEGARAFEAGYRIDEVWPLESRVRLGLA